VIARRATPSCKSISAVAPRSRRHQYEQWSPGRLPVVTRATYLAGWHASEITEDAGFEKGWTVGYAAAVAQVMGQ